jgi:uncharacterized membrane protein YfcA
LKFSFETNYRSVLSVVGADRIRDGVAKLVEIDRCIERVGVDGRAQDSLVGDGPDTLLVDGRFERVPIDGRDGLVGIDAREGIQSSFHCLVSCRYYCHVHGQTAMTRKSDACDCGFIGPIYSGREISGNGLKCQKTVDTPMIDAIVATLQPTLSIGVGVLGTDWMLVVLAVIGFLAGIGITALGPGGVFVTIALYVLTGLGPAVVAGTASATNIAAGLLGSIAYTRSGELLTHQNQRLAAVLSVTSVLGALIGVRVNAVIPERVFGVILGGLVMLIGVLVWYREETVTDTGYTIDPGSRAGLTVAGVVGASVGVPAGLLGIGGPVLAVPLLMILGVPLLAAVAVAQVQSVVIAGAATVGYLVQGTVSVPLVVAIGVPELVGIIIGWRVAQTVNPTRLKHALAATLAALGPYLAFRP